VFPGNEIQSLMMGLTCWGEVETNQLVFMKLLLCATYML
jgi:hypothetical protein